MDPSTTLSNDQFYSGEVQVVYYVSHSQNLVVKIRYGQGHQSSPGMAALGAVPLVIATPGTGYLGTVQLNLLF